jgi:hypothetical protein
MALTRPAHLHSLHFNALVMTSVAISARFSTGPGEVAQLVEHAAENRGVGGPIPPLPTRMEWAGRLSAPASSRFLTGALPLPRRHVQVVGDRDPIRGEFAAGRVEPNPIVSPSQDSDALDSLAPLLIGASGDASVNPREQGCQRVDAQRSGNAQEAGGSLRMGQFRSSWPRISAQWDSTPW